MDKGLQPTTLLEAVTYFADFEHCRQFMMELRWPDGVVKCPQCGSKEVTFLSNAKVWKCKTPHQKLTVVEVGSWVGDSARFLGKQCSTLYCVDTWAGPVETHRPMLSDLYQQFLSNMVHAELTDVVVPMRMTSTEAAMAFNGRADLVYLDGDHSSVAAYQDVMCWAHNVVANGVLCGDDWSWQSVRRGVEKAAIDLGRCVESEGETWWLR
jgi:hypothetical protein